MRRGRCLTLTYFNNKRKVEAIICTTHIVASLGFDSFKKDLRAKPLKLLQSLPYIGSVTCYHLDKNIDLPVVKLDRHLSRIANTVGYQDVQMFCENISIQIGDSVPVVDMWLWRFAVLTEKYIEFFCNVAIPATQAYCSSSKW